MDNLGVGATVYMFNYVANVIDVSGDNRLIRFRDDMGMVRDVWVTVGSLYDPFESLRIGDVWEYMGDVFTVIPDPIGSGQRVMMFSHVADSERSHLVGTIRVPLDVVVHGEIIFSPSDFFRPFTTESFVETD